MNIWKRIRQLNLVQLSKFSWLFLKHPLLIFPTIRATKETFAICNERYGSTHHKSNKANAFRHALWNALICKKVYNLRTNKQKSVFWTQKVTDLYEKVTRNEQMDEAMDLHNNGVGRICFLNFLKEDEAEMVNFIQNKAENAKKVENLAEIQKSENQLVYLHD